MTDEQFKQLRSLISRISDRIDQIELHLRRQDEIASHRYHLIYECFAPADYKPSIEGNISFEDETFENFLSRIKR